MPPTRRRASARAFAAEVGRHSLRRGRRACPRSARVLLRIRMEGEARGVEQCRMLAHERSGTLLIRGQVRALAAARLSGRSEESTQYSARMKRSGTIPEKSPGLVSGGDPARRYLTDQDPVVVMPSTGERDPGAVQQLPVKSGRDLNGRLIDRLGSELLPPVVRLVPDRPEVDPGEGGGDARRCVTAAERSPPRSEQPELVRRGPPGASEARRGSRRQAGPVADSGAGASSAMSTPMPRAAASRTIVS